MSTAALALRVFLIVVIGASMSGLIAYLGNKLGRHVGRRKMSLFGLRPKYTSNIITVATGSLIYLVTLAVLCAASWEVRELMGGLQGLIQQRDELVREIADLDRKYKAGPIALPFQVLSVGEVRCGLSKSEISEQIDLLLALANETVVKRNNIVADKYNFPLVPEDKRLVGYPKDGQTNERDRIINDLAKAPKDSTLIISVAGRETAYYGDNVEATFIVQPNPVVFRNDQVIVSGVIDGRKTRAQVWKDVVEFIYKDLPYTCLSRHDMIRNPITRKLDTTIDGRMMQLATEQIADAKRPMRLEVIANKEIHPLGPVDARLEVKPK